MKIANLLAAQQTPYTKNAGVPNNKNAKTAKSNFDTVGISAEAKEMFSTQPSTSNEERAAAGLRTRETPLIQEREFTVFSRNALEPHMEDSQRHLALMKRAILDPSRFSNADLTLEERTIMREGILQEAQRIADTYLTGEEAQQFVAGFENLIHEAEMIERGYVRGSWHGTLSLSMRLSDGEPFRSPLSQDTHAKGMFVAANMTDVQREEFLALSDEVSRLSALNQATENANAALRAFVESMVEYHNFQAQWDMWQSGTHESTNWFVTAAAAFDENSANIAAEIEAIRLDFRNQFNLNGTDAFARLFGQLNGSNAENLSVQWLTQLQIFNSGM
ncbi:MAG: hypothetical protein FWC16_11375 [Defluviitaleaceae bacterium]|nr:hypothetical protein [Defluviitaleaceae bacterium]MCL2275519.1 hypothetical protein [Defluviitaleaceae bacterium]